MDIIVSILQAIHDLGFSERLRNSSWLFPAVETIHVIAIVYVFGSIARLDLRLMGWAWTDRPITQITEEMLPYAWTGFAIAAVFGTMMWMSDPLTYLGVTFFDVKMIALALAFTNMFYFQSVILPSAAKWDSDPVPPRPVRLAGALSLSLWLLVLVCGRFIGFVQDFPAGQ